MTPGISILLSLCLTGWFNWKTIKTDNFTVIYKQGYLREATQSLHTLEYYRSAVVDLTGNDTRSVPVVIEDVGSMSNAYADPFFYNIHFFTYPPTFDYALQGNESWHRSALVHEHLHIAHLTRTAGLSRVLTAVIGAPAQSNMYSPGWQIEGITVYGESNISPYEGRLNDGYFDGYIAARIRDGTFPSLVEATNSPLAVPLDGIYLYGGAFFDFLASKYGEERFRRFFSVYGSCFWAPLSTLLPSVGFDFAARKVYGKSFPSLFKEWESFEEERPKTWYAEGSQVTEKGWYLSPVVSGGTSLYYVRSKLVKRDVFSARSLIQIVRLDCRTDEETVLANLTSGLTAPMKVHNGYLYYAQQEFKKGMANVSLLGFGATSTVHRKDLHSGEDRVLFTDDIRAFCILTDGSMLYAKDRVHAYGSEIWLFDGEGHEKLLESEVLVAELDARGERIVLAGKREYENPDIFALDLASGDLIPLITTPWTEGYLDLIEADLLRFTANYDGYHRLYELDIGNHSIRQITPQSFAQSGAVVDDALYYVGLNSSGNDIYRTEYSARAFLLPDWQPGPKPELPAEGYEPRSGGYTDVLATLFPAVRVPFVFAEYGEHMRWYLGALIAGGDATAENHYYAFIARDPDEERPVVNLAVQSGFFSPLRADFSYDTGGMVNTGAYYQFLARAAPGIRHAMLYSNVSSYDDFRRKEIAPGISFSFNYPFTTVACDAWFPFEREAWQSSINRNGQFASLGIRQSIKDGQLSVSSIIGSNTQDIDTLNLPLRGYDDVPATRGLFASAEYSHRLLPIRKGCWDINVYLEDLFGTVFIDYGFNHDETSFVSAGLELKVETKMAFGYIQFVQKVGVAINADEEISVYYGFTPAIEMPYGRKVHKHHFGKRE